MVYILMLLGFAFLMKGADILVDGSTVIAKKFGISDLVVGLTIVSLGTSMPELMVTILATIQGNPDVGVGNVLGSNISNILLILGITVVIAPIKVLKTTIFSEIPFSIIAALLVGFLANSDIFSKDIGFIGLDRIEGLLILFFFIVFFLYIISLIVIEERESKTKPVVDFEVHDMTMTKALLFILGGIVLLFLGGKWVVEGAVALAKFIGMSESFISLTIIAVGTSLPELVTSVVAAKKGNSDVAVGNIVGSNILNLLLILGLSAAILPIPMNPISNQDIFVVVLSSILLLVLMAISRQSVLKKWHGVVLISCYVIYTIFLVLRG